MYLKLQQINKKWLRNINAHLMQNPKGYQVVYMHWNTIKMVVTQIICQWEQQKYWIYGIQLIVWPGLLTCDFLNIKEIKKVYTILSVQHIGLRPKIDSDPWSCDLKTNREHLLSRDIHWTKFGNFQPKGSKDTGRTIIVPRIAVWPWPCYLNISRGHLLATSIHITKFSNFVAKASKDFKRITFCTWPWPLTMWPENQ